MKKKIGVFFGGPSAEHEISIITFAQAIKAIDSSLYEIIPVYVSLEGSWYTGDALFERDFYKALPECLSQVQEVILLPNPKIQGLVYVDHSKIDLSKKLPLDVCLLTFHGQGGEDGSFQGLFELADLAYTGCSVLASSVAMNKSLSKKIAKVEGVPVLPDCVVQKKEMWSSLEQCLERILNTEGLKYFPLFVKPSHLGSSIGISQVSSKNELAVALTKVFLYDEEAIIEPYIVDLMEVNVSILDGSPVRSSVVEIPLSTQGALSYEDKYLRGGTKEGKKSEGMASLTRIIDPQDLDPSIKKSVVSYALKIFSALGCSGVCRFDFIIDKKTGLLYFNELNPIPGSLSYYLWEKTSPPLLYTELLDQLIQKAEERKALQRSLLRHFGFKALK